MVMQALSQSDLARRLGVSRARVSQLLQHKSSPTLRTMVHIANALGCDVAPSVAPSAFDRSEPHLAVDIAVLRSGESDDDMAVLGSPSTTST